MSKQLELGKLFYIEIEKIYASEQEELDKIHQLFNLLQKIFIDVTQQERVHFTTIYARIAYISHKFDLSNSLQYHTYRFRKTTLKNAYKTPEEINRNYLLGLKVLAENVSSIFDVSTPEHIASHIPTEDFFPLQYADFQEHIAKIRVVAVEDDSNSEWLIAKSEEYPDKVLRIKYNDRRNENFNPTIKGIRNVFGFPVTLNLLEIVVDSNGIFYPKAIVVEPDYLVDVTSVSECFKENNKTEPRQYLLYRFLPKIASKSILLGNIANFFLDELIVNPDLDFKAVFPKTFRLAPFQFATMNDQEVREIYSDAQAHFAHLKRVILQSFETEEFHRKNCFLEPSFYSETYGLQGRLDLLHIRPTNPKKNAIVELKSGKPFRENIYGISHSHFTQTLLYDLMVKSAFGDDAEPQNFILYSKLDDNQLRFAPALRPQQYEALQIRNQLVFIEQSLINFNRKPNAPNPFERLQSHFFEGGGFLKRDVEVFEKIYYDLDFTEKKYFHAFASLVAREHQLAKTGIQGVENANGVASLWLNPLSEKEENYEIFSFLTIQKNASLEDDPIIIFSKTQKTNVLANFRIGDIAALYPVVTDDNEADVLKNQVFKGTITDLSPTTVTFRLRAKQFNQSIFHNYHHWNIEHDLMDSSFMGMYRGLLGFFAFPKEKRSLILTSEAPSLTSNADRILNPASVETEITYDNLNLFLQKNKTLTDEQRSIFKKIVAAKDYFLLWGPPGTGKTSVMLRHLTEYLMQHTGENVLLLAYTNRAVDEICEAIEANGEHFKDFYLRIGSRYGTDERFHNNLLDKQLEGVNRRDELRAVIDGCRMFVATVASMNGKPELLQLKKFDTIIIDEASQILEPQIIGLLPKFKRFVLIGDHRQLPAIVSQPEKDTEVADESLRKIGLVNLRNSLFERMYHRCIENNWHHAYDQLSHQGRMHSEIVAFPSKYFYGKNLHILPEGINDFQLKNLDYQYDTEKNDETRLATRRKLFFHTKRDTESQNTKVNHHEANLVGDIIIQLQQLYEKNGLVLSRSSIGVITPYRAQIAQIQQVLQEKKLPISLITVDTVERYQGGARDIIILSLCTNHASQVKSLVSLSDDGIDRKLNVALTRAKQQIIVLGNSTLLQEVGSYKELMEWLEE